MRRYAIEPVGDVQAGLGEGPCWDGAGGTLLWVDIPGGRVHRTDPASGDTGTIQLAPPVSAVLPTAGGGLLVACGQQIVILGPGDARHTVAGIRADPAIRFNDAKSDPHGRLWIGSMHTEKKPGTAALHRLDADGTLSEIIPDVTISNGLGWSPDGRSMYYVDTPTLRVDVLDYQPDTGEATNRRQLVDLSDQRGRPDGLTVDAEGCLWVALIGGGALHRYTSDGHLDTVVPLPVSHPTSCAFAGPELRDLYVTTASEPLSEAEREAQPLAGRLLRLRPNVAGIAAVPVVGRIGQRPDRSLSITY